MDSFDSQQNFDDVNEMMSRIMGNAAKNPVVNQQRAAAPDTLYVKRPNPVYAPSPRPVYIKSEKPVTPKPVAASAAQAKVQADHYPAPHYSYNQHSTSGGGFGKKLFITFAFIGLLGLGAYFGRAPIASLLAPPSPFAEKITSASIPLYYPAKLPGTFKIEIDSITQLESNLVGYTISDDSGKRAQITIKEAPKDLNYSQFQEGLSDVKDITTPIGTARAGVSGENMRIANLATGEAWLILEADSAALTHEDFAAIFSNLRSVKI